MKRRWRALAVTHAVLAVALGASCGGRSSLGVGRGSGGTSASTSTTSSEGGSGGGPPCLFDAACDDGDPCTTDACGLDGCAHAPDPAACDDGLACTLDSCDAVNGCVHVHSDAVCDDGADCTTDSCDLASDACVHVPHDTACDDAVACTDDKCTSVGCLHLPNAGLCDDGALCTTDACDPAEDCVHTPSDAMCDDGIGCTTDTCDLASDSCVHAACDGLCDNGVFCDGVERCDAAFGCVGSTPSCDLALGCGVSSCSEGNQACSHSLPPGCAPAGHLLITRADGALVSVSPYTGSITTVAGSNGTAHLDIAILNGRWFAIDSSGLVELFPGTNNVKKLFNPVGNSNSLGAGPDGKLYAAAHAVFRVDPDSGAKQTIGSLPPGHFSSGDIAFLNGRMFVSTDGPCGGALVEFDVASGTGTVLGGDGLGCVFGLAVVGSTMFTVNCDGKIGTFDPDTGVARILSVVNVSAYGAEGTP